MDRVAYRIDSRTFSTPLEDLKQVLKDFMYAFIGTRNPWKDSKSNAMLHQEFEQALRVDEAFAYLQD